MLGLLAALLVAAVVAEAVDKWQARRARALLDTATAALAEGRLPPEHLEAVALYQQALALYDFSHAKNIGFSTGVSDRKGGTALAAASRLLRIPIYALLTQLGLGASVHAGWAELYRGLQHHARDLRTAQATHNRHQQQPPQRDGSVEAEEL